MNTKQTDIVMTTERGTASRRKFLTTASALGLGLASSNLWSQANLPYKVIQQKMPTNDPSRVEVLEFFWFGCPHCYAFEPAINNWRDSKPEYVDFVREAPPLNPSWEQHSRLFYAAQLLGITDGMFDQTFNEIHKRKKRLRNPAKIAKFIESLDLGVDAKKFEKTMNSFAVNTALNRSINRAQQAGINAVPSIVINGKYLTGNTLAGSHAGIINVINELSEKEKNET